MTNKIMQFLGLASRARKVVTGETIFNVIRSKEAKLVIIGSDASENTQKKIIDKCTFYQVDYLVFGSIQDLSNAIGKNNRVAIAIVDTGFSKKLKEMIGG